MLSENHKRILHRISVFLIIIIVFTGVYSTLSYLGIGFLGFNERVKGDYVFYTQATGLAIIDVDKALSLCSDSKDLQDVCFKDIAKIISEKDFKKSLDICEIINDTKWRSECFFVVAESLFDKDVSLAMEVCEKSEMFKQECYTHLGNAIGYQFKDILPAVLACDKFPAKFKGSCFIGLSHYFGEHFGGDISSAVSACNIVPVEFRRYCFMGLGWSFGEHFGGDISSAVSACNIVPVEFRRYCFIDLGHYFGWHFSEDVNSAVSACNIVPVEFRGDCFMGLGQGVGRSSGGDVVSVVGAYQLVPLEFRNNYLIPLSGYVGSAGYVSSCTDFMHPYDFICFLSFGKNKGSISNLDDGCSSITDEDFKSWCYKGFGRGLITYYSGKVLSALSMCDSLSNKNYKFNCSNGVGEGVGELFSGTNSDFVLDKCSKLGEFSSYCFERVGKNAVNLYSYNLSKAFNVCYEINESFRNSCFIGLGKGLSEYFLYNPSLASMKCDELPVFYNADCKKGLEEMTKFYNDSFVES